MRRTRPTSPAVDGNGSSGRRTLPVTLAPSGNVVTTSRRPHRSATTASDEAATYPRTQLTTPPPHLRSTGGGAETEQTKTSSAMRRSRSREQPSSIPVPTGETSAAAAATEGDSQRRQFRPSGEEGLTRSRRQREENVPPKLPHSTAATSEEDQLGITQHRTAAPAFSVGITTAFAQRQSRWEESDSSSSRGRAFRGAEFAADDSEGFTEEEEKTCALGQCSSSDFLGTAASSKTAGGAAGPSNYDDSSDYSGGFLGYDIDEEEDLRRGVLQPQHFAFDTGGSAFPKLIHGILPDQSQDSFRLNTSPQGSQLSSRRLSERPSAREASTTAGGGSASDQSQDSFRLNTSPQGSQLSSRRLSERPSAREASTTAGGGSARREAAETGEKKPSEAKDSKQEAKGGGKKPDEEEDPYEEYPDHCGDLATFVEGRQVVEWDIPIFNGIVHVLGSSVLRPDIEAVATDIAFWQCTHQFCFECPFLTPYLLKFLDNVGDLATFVEGRQVVEWDIPIFNGIVHVLGSSVLRPDIEAVATDIAFWQCTHQFCFECPFLTPYLLKFLDNVGIITGKSPFEFMPPPGVRPDWVCRGAFDYYPAGWTKQSWLKYLETMHSSDKRIMKKNADLVARAAHERHQIALLYESVRLQSIEARRRYDPLRPIDDPFYDPQYKNMKKSFDEKNFECKDEGGYTYCRSGNTCNLHHLTAMDYVSGSIYVPGSVALMGIVPYYL
ncbi:uncharacterized protein EMH_0078370 [Eimeria mitis]|uniref:Uncharacterized protein n=1 Tax=Eimeria mitis TaxID=44415 RepID=U6K565_9EIME|nr:uncharacterized protein EMH_0078370 [Eimeria mitis]CDJ32875.1 hypothetical protein, conserved [Eimeria mitis]